MASDIDIYSILFITTYTKLYHLLSFIFFNFNTIWVCDRIVYLNAKYKILSNSNEFKYIFWLILLTYGQHEWTCIYILLLHFTIIEKYIVC